mgnify:FL=1
MIREKALMPRALFTIAIVLVVFLASDTAHAIGPVGLTFNATPSTIAPGGTATLTWSATNADFCSGNGTGGSNENNGAYSVSPAVTTSYTITCYNTEPPTTQNSSSKTVIVSSTPMPSASLSASPSTINAGATSTLNWNSTNATSCSGSGFTASGTSGSVVVSPAANTTYSITCNGPGGTSPLVSATVSVTQVVDLTAGTPTLNSGSFVNGAAITFSGAVANGGGTSTSATFSNRFQIDLGANGTYDTNLDATSSTAGINAAQTKTFVSPTWTATTGTYKIRLCVDSPTSGVTESNEGNNCGADYTFTVGGACTPTLTDNQWYTTSAQQTLYANEGLQYPYDCGTAAADAGFPYWNQTTTYSPGNFDPYYSVCAGFPSITGTVAKPPSGPNTYRSGTACVGPSSPTASLTASPTSINLGSNSTLTWSSTNATSCTGTGFSTGNATSGSVVVSPTSETTYTLTCSGAGGLANSSVTVSIAGSIDASVTANPTSITSGSNSTLTWSSINATSCTGNNFSTGGALSGSLVVSPSTFTEYAITCSSGSPSGGSGTWEYQESDITDFSCPLTDTNRAYGFLPDCPDNPQGLACTGSSMCKINTINGCNIYTDLYQCSGGSATYQSVIRNATVTVTTPAPTANISASPPTIVVGNNTTITWSSTDATSCTGTNFSTNGATSGSVVVSPSTTTTYSVSCTGAGGTTASSNNPTVTVTYPVPTANISASPTTVVMGNSATLTWSSTNATSCTGTNFSTSGGASGSAAVSPSATTTYTVACSGAGGTSTSTATVGISSGTFELTAGVPSIYSGSLIAGAPVRWRGTVTNGGTGSTSSTFNNRFQIDLGNNGSWNTNLTATSSIAGIASGQSKTALSPTWSATTGTHAIRLCADTPTSAISETNESNNCGSPLVFTVAATPNAPFISGPTTGYTNSAYVFSFAATDPASTTVRYGIDWDNNSVVDQYLPASGYVGSGVYQDATRTWLTTGSSTLQAFTQNSNGATSTWSTHTIFISTAPPPPPVALVTIEPDAFEGGQSAIITWSSSDATDCTGTGFSTGGATSGTVSTGPVYTTTTFSVSCTGTSGTDADSATLTITSAVDLTSGTPGLNSGSLYNGASVTFFANVNNDGNGDTTSTFSNRFQVDLNDNGSWDVNLDAANSVDGMLAGQSKSVISPSWTAVTGTHRVRMCADSPTSVVGEVDEANNCSTGYFTFTVTPTPECADDIDNNGNTFIDYPADAACTALLDGTEEVLASADLSVTAFPSGGSLGTPNVVKPGTTAAITWTAQNVETDSCTLSGDNGDAWSNLTGSSGTNVSSSLNGEVTFTLSCMNLDHQPVSVSATVRLTPRFQEL